MNSKYRSIITQLSTIMQYINSKLKSSNHKIAINICFHSFKDSKFSHLKDLVKSLIAMFKSDEEDIVYISDALLVKMEYGALF